MTKKPGVFSKWLAVALCFGIGIFASVIVYQAHEPEYLSNPSILDATEISEFESSIHENLAESDDMLLRVITGSFRLLKPQKHMKIEVLATLYDNDGLFLTEYAASRENIVRSNDLISFEIFVNEPTGMFDVSYYGFIVQGE